MNPSTKTKKYEVLDGQEISKNDHDERGDSEDTEPSNCHETSSELRSRKGSKSALLSKVKSKLLRRTTTVNETSVPQELHKQKFDGFDELSSTVTENEKPSRRPKSKSEDRSMPSKSCKQQLDQEPARHELRNTGAKYHKLLKSKSEDVLPARVINIDTEKVFDIPRDEQTKLDSKWSQSGRKLIRRRGISEEDEEDRDDLKDIVEAYILRKNMEDYGFL